MGRRWLFVAFLLLLGLPVHAGHKPPPILLRVYVQTAGEGLPTTQAMTIQIPPNNEQIQIRALPEMNEKELVSVQPDAAGAVHLQFNHQGQVALDAVTAENNGRILVVFINGNIVYAPVIDETLSTGELVLPHPLPPLVIQLLQQVVQQNLKEAART